VIGALLEQGKNENRIADARFRKSLCRPAKSGPGFVNLMSQSKQSAWQLMFVLSLLFVSIASAETPVWRCGWYSQPPLQFSARQGDVETVTGLDVQLIRAITREAGHLLRLEEIPWERHQQLLKSGDCDLAFGAPWTAEREKFLRFSAPYRQEENALYVRIRDRQRYPFKDAAAFLAQVRSEGLRLGVVKATAYLWAPFCSPRFPRSAAVCCAT
jgi:ABC-type amino acid transport substrate-binding protein